MSTLATTMYETHHHPFTTTTMQGGLQQQAPADDEQYITTFFCRALYDYQSQDSSSLSFQKDDVIEVLTQLESGWWDGLLGDERGWFPSNYVTVISDEQAEAALSGSEYSSSQPTDMSDTLTAGRSVANGSEWMDDDIDQSRNGLYEDLGNATLDESSTPYNDFWMPQVTPEGAVSFWSARHLAIEYLMRSYSDLLREYSNWANLS